MTGKILTVLSSLLLSWTVVSHDRIKMTLEKEKQPNNCNVCYYMGNAFSIGATNGANNQTCIWSSDHKGAVWVNHGATFVPKATCAYCALAGTWYSEGAVNGTQVPVQYCTNGQWK
jgi:hypothetical protein